MKGGLAAKPPQSRNWLALGGAVYPVPKMSEHQIKKLEMLLLHLDNIEKTGITEMLLIV
jgi:hypothetical protein